MLTHMILMCCVLDREPIMLLTFGFDIQVTKRIVEMRLSPTDEFEARAWPSGLALLSSS